MRSLRACAVEALPPSLSKYKNIKNLKRKKEKVKKKREEKNRFVMKILLSG